MSSRSGSSIPEFDEVRLMYHDAMQTLSTWDAERGYEPVTEMFRKISEAAREQGDTNLQCEASLIVMEIEVNSMRRLRVAPETIDVDAFRRAVSEALQLGYDNGDRISETRAHLVAGDFYALVCGDREAALEHYGMARAFARKGHVIPIEMEACRRMRWTMSACGEQEDAVALSREVLRLARKYETSTLSDGSIEKRSSKAAAEVPLMLREHWYLGGYENQEVYALKEHGCVLRGETRLLTRPVIDAALQLEAARAFEDALVALEEHWNHTENSFESDSDGASIKLSLLAHLADIHDNHVEPTAENHAKAVECRRAYEALAPGKFSGDAVCAMCEKPIGGLSIEDARVKFTFAWDVCQSSHHYHSACFDAAKLEDFPECVPCRAANLNDAF